MKASNSPSASDARDGQRSGRSNSAPIARAGMPFGNSSHAAPIIASRKAVSVGSVKYQSAAGVFASASSTNHNASMTCPTTISSGSPNVGEATATSDATTPTGSTKKQIT